jgi:hypothetical protein
MASTDVQPSVGDDREAEEPSRQLKIPLIVAVIGLIGSIIAALIGAFAPSPPRPAMAVRSPPPSPAARSQPSSSRAGSSRASLRTATCG